MANMSYCRFENIENDLDDCFDWLGEHEPDELSPEEFAAFKRLVRTCLNIAEGYDEYI